ncbi:MAG TPA: AraC family transcriptional regulator N-terminal domain-containing protein, partial [Cyclobacteriaceae bacterium]|nr:AraC family transcriptional regulator N-terminal domain-containing protein [Cyclobacteriaceae bacterium]
MNRLYKLQPLPVKSEDSLDTLVENRTAYSMNEWELNLYETHQQTSNVNLRFDDFVFTSMLRGKKVMRISDGPAFDYYPGESVIVPSRANICIDFPEAELDNPTQCLALVVSAAQINKILNELNEFYPKVDENLGWRINQNSLHLVNTEELTDIVNRFVRISITESTREKELLAELALKELLIRLMQTQARELFEMDPKQLSSSHRFAHVIQYIKENLSGRINPDQLSEHACMSRANFFRKFKEEFGISPGEYILKERLKKAKDFLGFPNH